MSVLSPAKYLDEDNTIKDLSFNTIYPVGSIYMSVNSANPSTLFGGTWEAWGAGYVPVGVKTSDADFSTVEKTGGEKVHALTIKEMPVHNHENKAYKTTKVGTVGSKDSYTKASIQYYDEDTKLYGSGDTTEVESGVVAKYGVPPEGGGGYHNNLQPYITCYMWKRTN